MKYITITSPDINNGLGCRVTIWVSGCSHRCKGCHNKETWDYNIGKPISEAYDELEPILEKIYIKGVTFSGGDPLDQSDESLIELEGLIDIIRYQFPSKDIWIYGGEVFDSLIENPIKKRILKKCNVLVDGPFILEQRDITLPFRGSTNQRVIDLKRTFECGKIIEKEIE